MTDSATTTPGQSPVSATAAGSNAERSRAHNRQVVLGHIRSAGLLGRAEIARAAGLSVQAVSNIIAGLEQEGLLLMAGRRQAGRGLPAPQYSLNPVGAHALGFDIRPETITASLINLAGQLLLTRREALIEPQVPAVARQLARLKQEMLDERALERTSLLGAGVVMPGPFIPTGLADTPSVLPRWQSVNVTPHFSAALRLDVLIENDANAAAVAERVCGHARQLQDFVFIYFGSGLGLGIVSNGRLFRGSIGNAGELGHIPVPSPDDTVTSWVPLETIVSRQALQARLHAVGCRADNADELNALFDAGEPVIQQWLVDAATALSHAIQVLENLFDPQSVIIGGALPDTMLRALIAQLKLPPHSIAHREHREHERVLQGTTGGNTAALGAASLVINTTFTPHLDMQTRSA